MKRVFLILILIVEMLLLLNFNSCQKLESIDGARGEALANPRPHEEKQEVSDQQKWQEMVATDINTLQMGKTSAKGGNAYVVSFHPQGQTRSVDAVDEINITFPSRWHL